MSRVARGLSAALCGTVSAVFYLSALTGSPGAAILVSLAQLPLFVAGLWCGTVAGASAGLVATGIVLVAAQDLVTAGLYAGLYPLPVVLLTGLALVARPDEAGEREWCSAGALTAWLTGLALVGCALVVLSVGGPAALQALLRRALAPALAQLVDATAGERAQLTDALTAIIPGVFAASWMMLTITNGVLAQGILMRFGANRRPSPRLAMLRLPIWLIALLGAAAFATILGGSARFVGINVMIALSVPFCLAGLGVMHAVASRLARPAIPLVTFYALAGLLGWPLLLAALLGLIDMPLDLRRRLVGPASFGGKIDG
jgi:hypothetical protein